MIFDIVAVTQHVTYVKQIDNVRHMLGRHVVKYLVLALVVFLVLVLSTFGIQNPSPVNVRFLQFQSGFVPLYVIMLVSTVIGMALALLVGLPGRIQRQLETRRLRQQLSDAEKQIAELKERVPAPVMQPLPEELSARAV
ncbi:MAG: hypothetical protein CYG59_03980 [Chloroflexi bacterium]|nr:MAG: hypothetical protein CYG59_03980 [Chloroflexota bacterium]